MYIKELVLENFKSFGRRTELPFYDDFTTISGPNGAGKSNIIDAILFGLGLARTRGIRARKLTDLIYNPGHEDGSVDRDRPRKAFVEVTLDNQDRTLTRGQVESAAGTTEIGDVDEIIIKRTVKRTENNYYSRYYINERSVNLSDIQDLLAQAGVTPEGYNVVMQGDVTGIINMTPYRRREIIDEIAGVAEFDEKKEAALEELETVSERIDEAELRIEEKETRLDQLEDERETALRYQKLRDQHEEYTTYKEAAELEDKREELSSLEERIEADEDELVDQQGTLDTYEGRLERLRDELEELNQTIEQKGEDEQLAVKREIEEIKGEIARLEDRIESAESRIDEAERDRRNAFVRIDQAQEKIESLETDQRETKLEKARLTGEIEDLSERREEVEQEIEETDTEYESLRETLEDKKQTRETLRNEKNDLQREQDRRLDEARRRSEELEDLRNERSEIVQEIERLEQDVADLETERERAEKNKDQIEAVVTDLKSERSSIRDDLNELENELEGVRNEYAELEAAADQNGDESYGRAVTTILNAGIDGVHGTIGQLGGVDHEVATACETAAGARLANVVVDNDGVGATCIDHLKARNAGRATFLPLTEMDHRSLPSLPDHPGVIDFAYNLVEFDDRYAGVFSYVLGSTLVVEDLDTARELMGSYRLVTLDGELVEKSGAMTGGSQSGSRYSFSKTGKGRLERVAERIQSLEDERQSLQDEITAVEERLDGARDRRADAVDQLQEIDGELERTREKLESRADRRKTIDERIAEKEAERDSVDERMQELADEIEETDAELESIEAEIDSLREELSDSRIAELTDELDEIDQEIAARKEQIDDLDSTLNEIELEISYAENSIEDLHDEIESAQNRKAEEEDRIAELEDQIDTEEDRLSERRERVEELEEELAELKDERKELEGEIREAVENRDQQRTVVERIESRLEGRRERVDELRTEIAELERRVEQYDPDDIPDFETVQAELERLSEEMEALEPVNMLAIDEYDRVQGELDELEERRGILVDERDGILDRIDSYETQKKETFMEAFEGINEHFQDVFGRLSAGTGRLALEDEADPFDGGLTMEAQPGDKPIQRLDAMSGGEKSLTALAFIFAIQRFNPAPFYALDEVDAFLDAVNAERVGELVDDLADAAQFVVVSHRTALLDRSDRALGVTMREDNQSAVTGIDLSSSGAGVPADD